MQRSPGAAGTNAGASRERPPLKGPNPECAFCEAASRYLVCSGPVKTPVCPVCLEGEVRNVLVYAGHDAVTVRKARRR
jgi:hypothetical protein